MARRALLAVLNAAAARGAAAESFSVITDSNAVPSGTMTTQKTLDKCEATCVPPKCLQWSWNLHSNHCYVSGSGKWDPISSDHITSGCLPKEVNGCPTAPGPMPPAPPPPPPPAMDGVLRKRGDGAYEALLKPPYASNHASFVQDVAGYGQAMAWFSGVGEGKADVAIVVARRKSGDTQWSDAKTVQLRKDYSNQNPVMYQDTDGTVFLWHSSQGAGSGESDATVWQSSSTDLGETFSADKMIWGEKKGKGRFIKNRVIPQLNGTWLMPMYYQEKPNTASIRTSPSHAKGDFWGEIPFNGAGNRVQPSVLRPVAGQPRLLAYFRDREAKHVYYAESADDGATWTECEALGIPNNNAGLEPTMLAGGGVALVSNPVTSGRALLTIQVSADGKTGWNTTVTLEQHSSGEYSYPTLYRDAATGCYHVSYTYLRETVKHVAGDEAWIRGGTGATNCA